MDPGEARGTGRGGTGEIHVTSVHRRTASRSPEKLSPVARVGGRQPDDDPDMTVRTNGSGLRGKGRRRQAGGATGSSGPDVPEETFLSSLRLSRDQLLDFHQSEGHFLYLRQKSGTDATAYNLEVSRAISLHQANM